MNFRKISERGGGVISDPKNFVAKFGILDESFCLRNFWKKGREGGGVTSDPKKFIAKSVLCREAFLESKIKVYGTAGSVQNNWPLSSCASFV